MLRRFFKGSSSQSSEEKQAKENEKAKYNLPRLAEVRSCEWPCENFLKEAGIRGDFYALIEIAGLTGFMNDRIDRYLLLTNTFVQNFYFILRSHRLKYHFIYMTSSKKCLYVNFARYVGYLMREN